LTVPHNNDLKRLVRARMAETGENYTQALTALLDETPLGPLPDGWFTGSRCPEYAAGLLPPAQAYDGDRVLRLRLRADGRPGGFGTIMRSIDAAPYRGRRVRFSAALRGRGSRAGPASGCGSTRPRATAARSTTWTTGRFAAPPAGRTPPTSSTWPRTRRW
jgi:hypothetical protein